MKRSNLFARRLSGALRGGLILVALSTGAQAASAQQATELYIPIGRSPGLSGQHTVIGHVREITADHTMTVVGTDRVWTVRMADYSRVFLDRSRAGLPNTYGTHDDCKPGVLVEVKFEGRCEPTSVVCDWVKVRPREAERPAAPPRRRR